MSLDTSAYQTIGVEIRQAVANRDRTLLGRLCREYLLIRLRLDGCTHGENLYQLCVLSIKKNHPVASTSTSDDALDTYDCSREELAIRKKTLLIISMEKLLDIRLDDDLASDMETVTQLSDAIYFALLGE